MEDAFIVRGLQSITKESARSRPPCRGERDESGEADLKIFAIDKFH